MAEILLINPRKRAKNPARKAKRKSNPSPAQRRARAAFAAAARARAKGASTVAKRTRRSNPAKRRTTRRHNPIAVASHHKRRRVRRHNPIRHHARRRRNPIGLNAAKPMQLLTPALVGALGATAVNTVLANFGSFLPASMLTGNMSYITRALASLGLAAIGGKSGKHRAMIMQAAEGSLTVTFHDAIVNLSGGLGMQLAGRGRMGMYMPGRQATGPASNSASAPRLSGMGAYLTGSNSPQAATFARRQQQMAGRATRGMKF